MQKINKNEQMCVAIDVEICDKNERKENRSVREEN